MSNETSTGKGRGVPVQTMKGCRLSSFTRSWPRHRAEAIGQLQAPTALDPGDGSPVPVY